MKKIVFFMTCFIFIITMIGCRSDQEVSEDFSEKVYNIVDVNELEIKDIHLRQQGNFFGPNVYIIDKEANEDNKVVIKASVDLLEEISVNKIGNELIISGNKYKNYVTKKIEIYVYGYTFNEIDLANVTGRITKSSMSSTKLDLDFSDASSVIVDEIETQELDISLSGASSMKIEHTKAIEAEIDLSGVSSLVSNTNVFENIDVELSGASYAEIIDSSINNLKFKLSGASKIITSGIVTYGSIDASGASSVKMFDMTLNSGKATISSASLLELSFISLFEAKLSGASKLEYETLDGIMDVVSSGGSTVNKK